MPSRQERRAAARDASRHAPARAAAGAAGAAAALANFNVIPLGDWSTQAEDPMALVKSLGARVVNERAAAGDGEAQYSRGCLIRAEAGRETQSLSGAAGRKPLALVGFNTSVGTLHPPMSAHQTDVRRCPPQLTRPPSEMYLRVPTLIGGGLRADRDGGAARARVRYGIVGSHSLRGAGIRSSHGMVHQGRGGRVAESDVRPRGLSRQGIGLGGAGLPGGGGLVPPCGRGW